MSRYVLAPLSAALALFSVLPAWSAEPAAPLFVVEQQRASMVARLAQQWGPAFDALPGSRQRTHEDLANTLWTLRADRLFAVSLAGELDAVERVLTESASDALPARDVQVKALGDANADLTYTPLNPCRILDTRAAGGGGPLAANVARTFNGFAADFSTQGGTASNCAIPNGVAALAMNVYAVNPTNLGFIKVWPANATEPAVSTVNYQVGITAIATGALVPVDAATSNRFSAKSPAQVDFIADVVGYFRAPGRHDRRHHRGDRGGGAERRRHRRRRHPRHRHRRRHRRDDGQQRLHQRPDPQVQRQRLGLRRRRHRRRWRRHQHHRRHRPHRRHHHHHRHPRRRYRLPAAPRLRHLPRRLQHPHHRRRRHRHLRGRRHQRRLRQRLRPGRQCLRRHRRPGNERQQLSRYQHRRCAIARLEPTGASPNVMVGNDSCALGLQRVPTVGAGVEGAVIAGGGAPSGGTVDGCGAGDFHKIWDNNGAIGGGFGNTAGNGNADTTDAAFATVSGGVFNSAAAYGATVGGGDGNQATWAYAVVSGGNGNVADGSEAPSAAVSRTRPAASVGTVPGGELNVATGVCKSRRRPTRERSEPWLLRVGATAPRPTSRTTSRPLSSSASPAASDLYTNKAQTTGVLVARR